MREIVLIYALALEFFLKSMVAFFTFSFMVMAAETGIDEKLIGEKPIVVSGDNRFLLAEQFKTYPSLKASYAELFQILGLDDIGLLNASDENRILTGDLIEQYSKLINELLQIRSAEKKIIISKIIEALLISTGGRSGGVEHELMEQ